MSFSINKILAWFVVSTKMATLLFQIDLFQTLQTNVIYYRGIGHALQTIVQEEGILGLYKGLEATLLV